MKNTKKFLELMVNRLWPYKVAAISDVNILTIKKILDWTHTNMNPWTLKKLISNWDRWYSDGSDRLVDMQTEISLILKRKNE